MGKKAWIADDGKIFETKRAMEAYEQAGPHAELIDAYLETVDVGGLAERSATAQLTRIQNILRDFLAWQDSLSTDADGNGE